VRERNAELFGYILGFFVILCIPIHFGYRPIPVIRLFGKLQPPEPPSEIIASEDGDVTALPKVNL